MKIRFSHNYPKLHGQTSAKLLEYDTAYFVKPFKDETSLYAEKQHYPLPTGNYLQLVFLGNLRIPFCTIRKAYPLSKETYYRNAIGQTFELEVCET